uniref:LITAF domain-containing protein n=1 Tax=Mesocestoides corti TaxID=53468 RepID=A0A5K3FDC2_MESCO
MRNLLFSMLTGSQVELEVSESSRMERATCRPCYPESNRDVSHYPKVSDESHHANVPSSPPHLHNQNEPYRSTEFNHHRHQTPDRQGEAAVGSADGSDKARFTGSHVEIEVSQPSDDKIAAICRQCPYRSDDANRDYIHYPGANSARALNRGVGAFLLVILTIIKCHY